MIQIIAYFTMSLDHIGRLFFPNIVLFSLLGRLAFPLFAYGIAIGYTKTSNFRRKKKIYDIYNSQMEVQTTRNSRSFKLGRRKLKASLHITNFKTLFETMHPKFPEFITREELP
ncbi:TraX protein, partial [Paenibacillus tianmuensis]